VSPEQSRDYKESCKKGRLSRDGRVSFIVLLRRAARHTDTETLLA
jgi:hypothetical protein